MPRATAGCRFLAPCIILVLAGLSPIAYGQSQSASDLRQKIRDAYDRVQTYRASVRYENSQQNGRWRLTQLFEVAYDRTANSLRFDRPDMLFITDGQYLRFKSDMIPGRFVEVRLKEPLKYTRLIEAAPFLSGQIMPDVVMLLGGDPVEGMRDIREVPPDYQGRPGLRYDVGQGIMTLRVDGDTFLITQATLEKQASVERGRHVGPVTITYDLTIHEHNEQFTQEWFVFDTSNAQAVRDWGDLLAAGDVEGRTLQRADAPEVALPDTTGRLFKLSESKADVVVLGFWASWGGPQTYRALEAYQEVATWAQRRGRGVDVQTIAVQDSEEEVRQVVEVKRLGLPVLMDRDGEVAKAYRIGPIPHTVVIHKGQIVQVHVGLPSDFERMLREEVEDLLDGKTISRR